MICQSAANNKACIVDENVQMFDWGKFLPQYFTRIEHILRYHHFVLSKDGTVATRFYIDDEQATTTQMLKANSVPIHSMPTIIPPEGLSSQRQWYLYENIREFCKDECKDLVCPKPDVPKPRGKGIRRD